VQEFSHDRYVQSENDKMLHWRIGPLQGHRGCGRNKSSANRLADSQLSPPAKRNGREYFDCQSISCRPGDPYGCSMMKGRLRADQAAYILDRWFGLDERNSAYLGLWEVWGSQNATLQRLLDEAHAATARAFDNGAWHRSAKAAGLVGQLRSLTVTRSRSGAWIARRWIVWGVHRGDPGVIAVAVERAGKRWKDADDTWVDEWRLVGPWSIPRAAIPATARHITDTTDDVGSTNDADERYAKQLDTEFGSNVKEQSPAELADAYRRNSDEIAYTFKVSDRHFKRSKSGIVKVSGSDVFKYRFDIDVFGDETYNIDGAIPAEAVPFVEYATTMESEPVWSARQSSDPAWSEIIVESQKIEYRLVSEAQTVRYNLAPKPPRGPVKK
jgi:hypothetical protein